MYPCNLWVSACCVQVHILFEVRATVGATNGSGSLFVAAANPGAGAVTSIVPGTLLELFGFGTLL